MSMADYDEPKQSLRNSSRQFSLGSGLPLPEDVRRPDIVVTKKLPPVRNCLFGASCAYRVSTKESRFLTLFCSPSMVAVIWVAVRTSLKSDGVESFPN